MKTGVIGHSGVVGKAVYLAINADYGLNSTVGSYQEMANADFVFVCVPTPEKEDGSINMDILFKVIEQLSENQIKEQVIIIKSTVLPGTNKYLSEKYKSFIFMSSPEFVTEANAIDDFKNPYRMIVGFNSKDQEKAEQLKTIYQTISTAPIYGCTPIEAELAKYFSNIFLSMKVIFANQAKHISDLCDADYDKVKVMVGSDPRITHSHLNVTEKGGYDGMCFPKDTKAFQKYCNSINYNFTLLDATIQANKKIRNE
jgi:UDPglucose 6-dehydrogenase